MIHIIKAEEKDLDDVLMLVNQLLVELEDQPDEFVGIDKSKVLSDFATTNNRFSAFLAQADNGKCIGVATVMEAFAIYAGGNYGIIDEMYVAPGYRSLGIGKKLIDAIKQHATAKRWLRIDVTAPPEAKWERTVRFYETQGFVLTGPKLRYMLP